MSVFADSVALDTKIITESHDITDSEYIILDIKSKPPFVNIEERKIWNLFDDNKIDDEKSDIDVTWLSAVINFIVILVEAMLWLLPLLIIYFLYRYREYWKNGFQAKRRPIEEKKLPETLFGLDIREDNLPDNIKASAQDLWRHNKHRDAISLLYRSALLSLLKQYQFTLSVGATEQDCVNHFKEILEIQALHDNDANSDSCLEGDGDQQLKQFSELTSTWINAAYAHHYPDENAFNCLCVDWNDVFSNDRVNKPR